MKTKNLNMPNTDFTQRSESKTKEPMLLNHWKQNDVYNRRNKLNGDKYVLHSGPPFLSGNSTHLGHTLNMVLKDMVVKYKLMKGFKVEHKLGYDAHGLPTELNVQKKFGSNLSTEELRQKCREYGENSLQLLHQDFYNLGTFFDNDYYLTMSKEYESKQLEVFYTLLNKGLLYTEEYPVYYSYSSRTVLAEAELEYQNKKDTSCYFTLVTDDNTNLLVWTTQPWTVLGNVAVCVHPDFTYYKVMSNDRFYLVGENGLSLFDKYDVVKEFSGLELKGLEYTNVLTNTKGVVVADDFVKSDSGTGLVHLCPAHGDTDFLVCHKNGLSGQDLTDNKGNLLYNNLPVFGEGNMNVLQQMSELNMVFKTQEVEHSYPFDWRTKKPVYYKLSKQFFVDLSKFRKEVLECLKGVDMTEERYMNRLKSMLENRDRWCLSRQRKWGFPCALFMKGDVVYMTPELQTHLLNLFKEHGGDCWFNMSVEELLPNNLKHMSSELTKSTDTLDVWFDSGSSFHSVLNDEVADLYLEGSDQSRGWFQSSLLLSVAMNNKAPYKKVLTHGFVLDQNGRKMSKSEGNVVTPKEVMDKYNTDVLRLWVASASYSDDVRFSYDTFNNLSNAYFKFRNTLKYLLGNMYGYDGGSYELSKKDLDAKSMTDDMYTKCLTHYDNYDFKGVYFELTKWVSDYSSFYLDNDTKSFLYEFESTDVERLKTQEVLYYSLDKFLKVLAPMCPFLSEDAYQHLELKELDSVFFEQF